MMDCARVFVAKSLLSRTGQVLGVLESHEGPILQVRGHIDGAMDEIAGIAPFDTNRLLATLLWISAHSEAMARRSRRPHRSKQLSKHASKTRADVVALARLCAAPLGKSHMAWCSGCLNETRHHSTGAIRLHGVLHLCESCGSPTVSCKGPRCSHMAVVAPRSKAPVWFCAEHTHAIAGFDRLEAKLQSLEDYAGWTKPKRNSLSKITKYSAITVASAAAIAATAGAAAPAIGGAVGGLGTSLTGAAATSYGLALLGGGSLAAGGMGMAGGTMLITGLGAVLGAGSGALTTRAWTREDKSFKFENIRVGEGPAVIIIGGFLTEGKSLPPKALASVSGAFPKNPLYQLHWGASELTKVALMTGRGAVNATIWRVLVARGSAATRFAGKQFARLGLPFLFHDVLRNPWLLAQQRASKTAVILADIVQRLEVSVILVGHSLGGKIVAETCAALGSAHERVQVDAAHLLGAAKAVGPYWANLSAGAKHVYNYHSRRDQVLSKLFKAATGGTKAIGAVGIQTRELNIQDVDVSKRVGRHSDYFAEVAFRGT